MPLLCNLFFVWHCTPWAVKRDPVLYFYPDNVACVTWITCFVHEMCYTNKFDLTWHINHMWRVPEVAYNFYMNYDAIRVMRNVWTMTLFMPLFRKVSSPFLVSKTLRSTVPNYRKLMWQMANYMEASGEPSKTTWKMIKWTICPSRDSFNHLD